MIIIILFAVIQRNLARIKKNEAKVFHFFSPVVRDSRLLSFGGLSMQTKMEEKAEAMKETPNIYIYFQCN
jgi:hypothetical protein